MTTAIQPRYQLAANGWPARLFLACLATAGIFFTNISPIIVNALTYVEHLSSAQAGYVMAINTLGAAFGSLAVVFIIKYLPWRLGAGILLILLMICDCISPRIEHYHNLLALRFIGGVVGGMLAGLLFAVIARTLQAERTFGMFYFVQFSLGGLAILYLPQLALGWGVDVVFYSLLLLEVVSFFMLPFLSSYPPSQPQVQYRHQSIAWRPLLFVLVAIFSFQGAVMGVFAYSINLGESYHLSLSFIEGTMSASAWVGLLGVLAVMIMGIRFGRLLPLALAMAVTAGAIISLLYSATPWIYWLAQVMIGVTWAFVMPFLLGMTAAFDTVGRTAVLGGFLSLIGLSSGPMVAAWLLPQEGYPLIISTAFIAVLVAMVSCLYPAWRLDQQRFKPISVN